MIEDQFTRGQASNQDAFADDRDRIDLQIFTDDDEARFHCEDQLSAEASIDFIFHLSFFICHLVINACRMPRVSKRFASEPSPSGRPTTIPNNKCRWQMK